MAEKESEWKQKYMDLQEELKELEDFQESSRALEKELEHDLSMCEKERDKYRRELEVSERNAKQAQDQAQAQNKALEEALKEVKDLTLGLQVLREKARVLEQENDDYANKERVMEATIQDMREEMDGMIEEAVFSQGIIANLEGDLERQRQAHKEALEDLRVRSERGDKCVVGNKCVDGPLSEVLATANTLKALIRRLGEICS